MSADSSAFSCLPLAVRDSLLQQAFQQLDQRHLFGVAPRVCRLWHQLSLSIITSLDVTIITDEAAEQLSLWMQKHGAAGLKSLLLHFEETLCWTPAAHSLLQSLGAAIRLQTLEISADFITAALHVPLPPLTDLTSLSIVGIRLPPTAVSFIPSLISLNSLSLRNGCLNVDSRVFWSTMFEQMATRLVRLTSLDLAIFVRAEDLAHLRALPQLKQLSLDVFPVAASSLRHLHGLPVTSICIQSTTEVLTDASDWLHSAASGLKHLLLHVDDGPTTPAGFLPLHKAVHLESLSLRKVKPDMAQLAALTQLNRLLLRSCDMHDADVCRLSALTGLQSLNLSYNLGVTGAQGSMEVLARAMPQLESMELSGAAAQEAAERAFQGRKLKLKVWERGD